MKKLKDVPFNKIYIGMPVTLKYMHESTICEEIGIVTRSEKMGGMVGGKGVEIIWRNKDGTNVYGFTDEYPSRVTYSYDTMDDRINLDSEKM